jgi:hypothetical protein
VVCDGVADDGLFDLGDLLLEGHGVLICGRDGRDAMIILRSPLRCLRVKRICVQNILNSCMQSARVCVSKELTGDAKQNPQNEN